MSDVDTPIFSEAAMKMETFLRESGKPSMIKWVFYEDTTGYKQKLWIRVPIPSENENLAESMYDRALKRGLGIEILAFRSSGDTSYCQIWFPASKEEAECALISGLKLSVREPLLPAVPVTNPLSWNIRKTINKLLGWPGDVSKLPRKNRAQNKKLHGTGP